MSEPRPGAVVVGTGFGCLTHVRALRNAGFEVRALVGRDPERTRQRARMSDVATACTDLAEALALPGVDAVTVATPPHAHAEHVLAAVAAGKHVVCEKPFAADAAQARRMYDAAEAAGVVHLVGTEFRYDPAQALLARTVADGAIGEPRLATFLLHIPLLADPGAEVPDWWARAEDGGGWLGAQASHVVDQVAVTLGPIAAVSAALPHVVDRDWTAEDTFAVAFRTRTGVDGFLQSTASDRGPLLVTTRIVGSRGTAWIDGASVMVADASGTRTVPVPAELATGPADPPPGEMMVTAYDWLHSTGIDMGPYTRLYEVFAARIAGRPVPAFPATPTFADGVAAMAVLDAIRRSAAERRWVDVAG